MEFLWRSVRGHPLAFWLVVTGCIGLAVLINEVMPPSYRANVSLVANITSNPESSTYNEFLASQMLTKTYEDAIQSRSIAMQVRSQVGTSDTVMQLLEKIKVRTDPGTLVIMLSYTGHDAKEAVTIANAFAETFISKSREIVTSANVSILDRASLEETSIPVSPRKALNIAFAAFTGLFAALSVALGLERRKGRKKLRRHLPDHDPELGDVLLRIEQKHKGGSAS